jgi:hypothetical protein
VEREQMRKWLNVGNTIDIQMPNEIFDDLNKMDFKTWSHKPFAYCYYYLVTYIYRNALFGIKADDYSQENILKPLMSSFRKVLYITKKNGVLDLAGYTKTTTDYPVMSYMDDGVLEFSYIKELRKEMGLGVEHSPRLSVKKPLKAFKRFNDSEEYTGTFYDYSDTHVINIETFIDIVSDVKLSCTGLYFYALIKMKLEKFKDGYKISNKELANYIGCSETTVSKYANLLEKKGYINSKKDMISNNFCLGKIYVSNKRA